MLMTAELKGCGTWFLYFFGSYLGKVKLSQVLSLQDKCDKFLGGTPKKPILNSFDAEVVNTEFISRLSSYWVFFYYTNTPWKYQKTTGFAMFLGEIEI